MAQTMYRANHSVARPFGCFGFTVILTSEVQKQLGGVGCHLTPHSSIEPPIFLR